MGNSSAAADYARVFYKVCEEEKIVDSVLYDIKSLVSIHDEKVRDILSIPIIPKETKKEILDDLALANYEQVIINLLKILVDNNQINLFGQILAEYQSIYQQKNDIKIVEVTFAKEPNSDVIDNIRKGIEKNMNKFVVILTNIDSSIIGGVKIEFDGKIIDNSVEKYLKELKAII